MTVPANKRIAPPSPDVQYLPAIFRRIQNGDIRMPAFQRGFVWKDNQIVQLLESIYFGFPIGSLLLWRADSKAMRVEDSALSFFPAAEERYPTHYILDGLQRLSSLYAVFHYSAAQHPNKFNIGFDLEKGRFAPVAKPSLSTIPLSVLFRAAEFVQYHQKLSKLENGDGLIDASVALHATFQEYLIPIVTLVARDVGDVVQIFERINSTGTRLSAVDFMRAVTWSEEFDLNAELDQVKAAGDDDGFDIPHETLVKLLAIALEVPAVPEQMTSLSGLSSKQLRVGISKAKKLVERVVAFLQSQLHVHSYSLVPYEAQFLALAGFFRTPGAPTKDQMDQLVRWYWTASLNEDMQGRSEHQVARVVQQMESLRAGKLKSLKGKLALTSHALKERRFRWGAALPSAMASMLARKRCRSLVTGKPIPFDDYMTGDAGRNYVALLSSADVERGLGRRVPAGKVVANIVVASNDDLVVFRQTSITQIVKALRKKFPEEWLDILSSQMINSDATDSLLKGRSADFLQLRAEAILAVAKTLSLGE